MKRYFILLFLISILSLAAQEREPYVILVSFDGFRWDYINRNITPNLEKIRRKGVHALSMVPCFPTKTFPNHIAILTGMYPQNHGIISNSFVNPFNGKKYDIGKKESVSEPEWYNGEFFWETARRNGIITASFFWPGSEISVESRRPNYFKEYEHTKPYIERIDTVISWLSLPHNLRPGFITLYFHETDSYGHDYGPESAEINGAIKRVDSLAGYLFDRLSEIGLDDSVNVIFVSDHGMSATSEERVINIDRILSGIPFENSDTGPFAMIRTGKDYADGAFDALMSSARNYKVYKKNRIPEYLHYSNHPFIWDILIIAEPGWLIETERSLKEKGYGNRRGLGNHGYENYYMEMHALFVAIGPAFKRGLEISSVLNVDIYPLLCRIFNIPPRSNIDGKIERIEYILEEKFLNRK